MNYFAGLLHQMSRQNKSTSCYFRRLPHSADRTEVSSVNGTKTRQVTTVQLCGLMFGGHILSDGRTFLLLLGSVP